LTRRQRAILELIAEGRSNKEIASLLFLSEHTVHRHLANILERLGVATRAAAVGRMKSDSGL
jgi:DNA-binding NarL/FixJ family response regulator